MDVHVAQINIGTMLAPTDDPAVAEFMEALDRINAIADDAPGFVWRLQTDAGNATDIHVFPNPLELVNMSVWESIDALKSYVYRSEHLDFFRRRAEWFEADAKRVALWYVRAGAIPELDDAVRRVEFQERHGASPYSFGFVHPPTPLLIEAADPDDPAMRDLVARLDLAVGSGTDQVDAAGEPAARRDTTGDDGLLLCARYDGRIVGCGALRSTESSVGAIERIYVDPSFRGLKIGAALLDQLELAATRRGIGAVELETGRRQVVAEAMCRRAGYARREPPSRHVGPPATGTRFRKTLR